MMYAAFVAAVFVALCFGMPGCGTGEDFGTPAPAFAECTGTCRVWARCGGHSGQLFADHNDMCSKERSTAGEFPLFWNGTANSFIPCSDMEARPQQLRCFLCHYYNNEPACNHYEKPTDVN